MTTKLTCLDGKCGDAGDWFAVRVKSNCERVASSALSSKGFPVCLPLCSDPRKAGRRLKDSPLFPGYVFSSFDPRVLLPVLTVPGVAGVVCCGRTPEPVDHEEMRALLLIAESGVVAASYPYLETGQSIRIVEGPLKGIEGLLIRERGAERLVISLSLLRRSIVAEVERRWVEPAGMPRRSAA